ncbi:MAG: multidrug effflux MFS transporter [Acidimicrobiia bacterium]|nr:multidrug effflux MFS transporter [Acidimicrobiia bacterium]
MTSSATSVEHRRLSRVHFTALLSMIMAMGALAIDMMLPAFDDMREHFGLAADSTQVAQVVTTFLIGMALAQIFYGPLSDRFGRKPVLYAGFVIYGLGALGAVLAPTLELVLVSRFIWGVGAAAPRVVAVSIVRDTYAGDEMSKAMSFIMAVFLMVPIVAPSIGAALLLIFPWQSVFAAGVVFVAAVAAWARVLPETLDPDNRLPIDRRAISGAAREVLTNRQTFGYMMAMTMTFAVFSSYLASSERIFGEIYGRPDQFPFIFGALAATMGVAILMNATLVERIGAKRMVHLVLLTYVIAASAFWMVTAAAGGRPSFVFLMVGMMAMLSLHALLIPNFNSIAMLPMGHIAGTASAVIGTISLAGGAFLGAVIDSRFTDTVSPIVIAFVLFGILALGFVAWADRGRLFPRRNSESPSVVTEPRIR